MSSALAELEALIGAAAACEDEVKGWLSTGFPQLNKILSGRYDGGFAYGRMYEIYGPSSSGKTVIAANAMIEAQKAGGIVIMADFERAFMVELSAKMGLNVEKPHFIHMQPTTWEQGNTLAMQAAELIRKRGLIDPQAPILFVLDSIAAAVPKSMVDKELDELSMNDTTALARVTSTTLKVINARASAINMTCLYLNQIRTKPGVVYGDPTCLRGDVMIPFVDGTSASIATVVERKIDKEVWSYNEATQSIEPRRIIGWHDNGPKPEGKAWVHIRAQGFGTKNGIFGMTVTNDHLILTQRGWVEAGSLTTDDKVVSSVERMFAGRALEFLKAVMAFDCSLVQPSRQRLTACLNLQDNRNPEYAKWKVEMLSEHLSFKATEIKWKGGSGIKYASNFSNELKLLSDCARNPLRAFEDGITKEQLAIAIMDDGHMSDDRARYTLSFRRFAGNHDHLERIGEIFADLGLTFSIRYGLGAIVFDANSSRKIAGMIAEHVPSCMEYKLPPEFRGKYVHRPLACTPMTEAEFADVVEVRPGGKTHQSHRMYDITVEGNHNYLAGNVLNGFVVHNCTPGGGAMEFYASGRLAVGRKKIMDKEKEFAGQLISLKAVKNKHTRPFQETELYFMFREDGSGYFDHIHSMIDYLVKIGKLTQSGARIAWTDGKSYFVSQLIKKVEEEGLYGELLAMLPS
ncbi:hypothetical protein [Ectothiorhodospira shaposhnikovii]|uniref:hypothetical protein n=1 Tax=Ectothiorhodospira shaposhnikovii TaxID=1054 RepID=UPI001EE88930|nr:hypothetical protein [Ectothiorhodospira shaposhnikovii]MCG5512784.1 hypothetical protein [Ectothiorhodospira shaposhnikovii]